MKKAFFLLPIAILFSACSNNTSTSTDDTISQTETAVVDTISTADTVEKTDDTDAYEKLKEEERRMMKDILKKRKTIQ